MVQRPLGGIRDMAVDTVTVQALASVVATVVATAAATPAGTPHLPVSLPTTAMNHRINTVADRIMDSATM